MKEPTNAVLSAKLDALKELFEEKFSNNAQCHKEMNDHLKRLNGQVKKNSDFRVKGTVYLAMAAFVISAAVTFILNRIG